MSKPVVHRESPSQTAGPYVHIGCTPNAAGISTVYPDDLGTRMITDQAKGSRIEITGCVWDGHGDPLKDAMIEFWQADEKGRYPAGDPRGPADPGVLGWARVGADLKTGIWRLETVKPGPVPGPEGTQQAPHISVWIVARGINTGLQTRIYFPQDDLSQDPLCMAVADPARIDTLVAKPDGPGQYRCDIRLQGPDETVFFDL